MRTELTDTTASAVRSALMRASQAMGGLTTGVVLNLVVMTDEADQYDAMKAASQAGREHPCQVIGVIARKPDSQRRLDAEIAVGENAPGQQVLLRIYGELNHHVDSVVMPLLVADTPVVIWWPGKAPIAPAADPLGLLGQRRITDSAASDAPRERLLELAGSYRPGDTDLAWGRTTTWRSLLAATFDQPPAEVFEATVAAEQANPSAELMVAWLTGRLGVPVKREISAGPGVTEVSFLTDAGKIVISRMDGRNATLSKPGQPDRYVALHRRDTAELLAEELRRLDPDEVYGEALATLAASVPPAAPAAPTGSDEQAETAEPVPGPTGEE
jgi:glucose-6-phosphate dehydrogenase assembly protein OpcA